MGANDTTRLSGGPKSSPALSCFLTEPMTQPTIAAGLILPNLSRTVAEEHLEELAKLIDTAGARAVARILGKRQSPDAATYIGKGKAEEIKYLVEVHQATLVVFDD